MLIGLLNFSYAMLTFMLIITFNFYLICYLSIFIFAFCFFIRLEADTISERDFACPPKRRKQDEQDDDVVLRKSAFNDDYKYRIDLLEPPQNDAFTKRYENLFILSSPSQTNSHFIEFFSLSSLFQILHRHSQL